VLLQEPAEHVQQLLIGVALAALTNDLLSGLERLLVDNRLKGLVMSDPSFRRIMDSTALKLA
jgi:hypothetical protein